jgi:hypothetical protein
MAWDDSQNTGDQIDSTEWNNHVTDQKGHKSRHESGGSDELNVGSLSGVLADNQPPDLEAQTVSSDTTADQIDTILADASGSAVTVTLPSVNTKVRVDIKKTDSSGNNVTIASPNAETIDGQSSITLSAQYASRTIASDGTDYYIV